MRKKVTGLIALAIVAIMLIATLIVLLLNPADNKNESSSSATTVSVLKLEAADISEIQVTNEKGGFTFVRKDKDSFKLKDKDSLPQNATAISSVITELTTVTANQSVTKTPEDLSIYGLTTPKSTIKIILNDKSEKTLIVGNEALSGDLYFKTADSEEVYTISSYSLSCYKETSLKYYDISITSEATSETIDYIKLMSAEKTVYELKKLPEASASSAAEMYTSTFEMVAPYKTDSNSTNLGTTITALSSLAFSEAVSDDFSKESLSKYGLSSPAFTLTYNYSGKSSTVYFGNKDENGNYYAYLKDRAIIYKMAATSASFLKFSTTDMVSALLYLRNINTVKRITLEGYGQNYSFELENSNAENTEDMVVKSGGKTYPQDAFRSLYQVIIGVSVTGNGKNPGGSPVATITFHTLDGTTDVLKYYKYDDRNLFFTINGEGSFYVGKTSVEKIFDNCKNYLNGDKIIV